MVRPLFGKSGFVPGPHFVRHRHNTREGFEPIRRFLKGDPDAKWHSLIDVAKIGNERLDVREFRVTSYGFGPGQ